jgi:DNA-binding transcriptional LysR family regulator
VELRQLEMLQAVVECGGYKAAGERLHLSHPAVHRQIKLLEEEVQAKLFQREGRYVQVTEAGKRLMVLADRLHLEIGDASSEIRGLTEQESGSLRLGTATTMLMFLLPRVLQRFCRAYPKVSVYVSTAMNKDIFSDIAAGSTDLGLVFSPAELYEERAQVTQESLYEEEFVLGVSTSHPFARRTSITVADLEDLPVITFSRRSTLRRYLDLRFRSVGLKLLVAVELENEETAAKMLELGVGAAILSRQRAVADGIPHFRIRELPLRCPVSLVYLKKGYLSPATREFVGICREECVG